MKQVFYFCLLFFVFCLLPFAFWSCSKSTNDTFSGFRALDYFTITSGATHIYTIDSIIFDPGTGIVKIDTFRWFAQEIIRDTFTDSQKNINYLVDRYEHSRNANDTVWLYRRTYVVTVTNQNIQKVEGTFRYIKLPNNFVLNQQWDGNAYLDTYATIQVANNTVLPFIQTWKSAITSVNSTETISNKTFSDVTTVEAKSDPNILTERRYQLEKYAKGIGLISRQLEILDTQILDPTKTWEKKAQKGFILRMTRTN